MLWNLVKKVSFNSINIASWRWKLDKKKKFLVECKHQQKKEFEVSLPMSRVIFLDLFDFLDQKLGSLTYLLIFP